MKNVCSDVITNNLLKLLLLLAAGIGMQKAYSQPNNSYQPPVFTDSDRMQKIEFTFPIIDSIFHTYAMQHHYPGFAYGLVVDGQLVHAGAFGYTDVEKKTPATVHSLFRIASMTKSFTAMAILKLRDEGKLQLDDPASKYIPEMKGLHYLTADASPITIRNLLTHAAGFPEDNPWGDRQLQDSDAELMALVNKGISFSNVPGVAYEYSNLGFTLLGHIVSKVSGMPYEEYITKNILQPLGMNSTEWEYTKVPPQQLAHGYRWLNEQWVEQPMLHDGAYGAMGGLITSIQDFSKYMALHQTAYPPSNDKDNGFVKRSSLREMQHPWNISTLSSSYTYPSGRTCATVAAYCYGLRWMKDCDDRVYVGHSGGLPGFGSNWQILPEYGIGIVSFANLTYAGTSTANLQVLDTLIALAHLQPRQLPPSPILQQRRDELVKILPDWSNATNSTIFAENFFMDYPLDSLKKEAAIIFADAGKIIKVNDVVPQNQLRGTFILEGEKKNIAVTFTLTPENPPLIQEYHIKAVEKK
jgi:CubicO group peptidase (beta-lactamase class C family)